MQLGITVGSSFAELCVIDKDRPLQPLYFKRIYLPSEPLSGALKALTDQPQIKLDKVVVASRILEKILETRLGGSVAQVVTRGFENWLYLRQPVMHPYFELSPRRADPLASQELIFGVTERVNHLGEIVTPLDLSELEFIASKLKMMNIEKICVDLMFADRNSAHLEQACQFFTERGFQLYCQAVGAHQDEAFVWRKNVLNACLAGTFAEHRKEIETAVSSVAQLESILFVDGFGCAIGKDNSQLSSSLFSPCGIIRQFYQDKDSVIVYLGMEKWAILFPQASSNYFDSPWGPLTTELAKHTMIQVQPTLEVGINNFGELDFGRTELGYEPGPMIMGRALKPTVFDCLLSDSDDPVLSEFATSLGTRRLKDTLQAMLKTSPLTKDPSVANALTDITNSVVDRIGMDVLLNGHKQKELTVTGIFAPFLIEKLKLRWPEIKWKLCPYSREIDGLACAGVNV